MTGPGSPPPWNVDDITRAMSKGGRGVLVNVSKSGGVFQFFGGRMTSRGQCPRGGGACECLHCAWIGIGPPQKLYPISPTGYTGRPWVGTLGEPWVGTLGEPMVGTLGEPMVGTLGEPMVGTLGEPWVGTLGEPMVGTLGEPMVGTLGERRAI